MKPTIFDAAETGETLSAEAFAELEPELRSAMVQLQHRLKSAPFSVLVIIAGVDGAGKGDTVNLLYEWFDPRFLSAVAFGPENDEERSRPAYWRFWRKLPPHGRIGVYFGSWYTQPILDRVYRKEKRRAFDAALTDINSTEQMLTDDGMLIVKFWFHLSKDAQERRLKSLANNPKTRWRVTETDWRHFKLYNRFRRVSDEAVTTTDTSAAPWTIIEGTDAHLRSVTVAQHLLKVIGARLAVEDKREPAKTRPMPRPRKRTTTVLDELDLSQKIEKSYKKQLLAWQGRLNLASRRARALGLTSVLVFEGADAAGKGGAIRRLTAALDARDYLIVPIAAPTDEERARHYLWRFWRWLPGAGQLTIFDRSWYGRVLVERVEGFATRAEWQRAYGEINTFEKQLCDDGVVLMKYWLHIDQDEQLRRFKEREKTAYKQFKITDEDYRNREKWPQYAVAIDEMIRRTSTDQAPWTLVPANDKRFARLAVLKGYCKALERAIKR